MASIKPTSASAASSTSASVPLDTSASSGLTSPAVRSPPAPFQRCNSTPAVPSKSLKQEKPSGSSEAKKKTGPMDAFVRPTLKRSASSMSKLDSHTDFLNSPLPRDIAKRQKIDPLRKTTVYGMLFTNERLRSNAEKVASCRAPDDELKKFSERLRNKPIHAPPVRLPTKQKDVLRTFNKAPMHTMSAPGLVNDYYSNAVDWSAKEILAIALDEAVYLYNAKDARSEQLKHEFKSVVSAVAFDPTGLYLAVGTANGAIYLFKNKVYLKKLRSRQVGDTKVNALAWNPKKMLLSAGTSNGQILHYDAVLTDKPRITDVKAHETDVCGLKWRADGAFLASGGNDAHVRVWKVKNLTFASFDKRHTAAVKALSWCPWNPQLLASGGGRNDHTIKIWNITTARAPEAVFDTTCPVLSIHWSSHFKQLAATHGAPHNNITIWGYPSKEKIGDIPAHKDRILHSALSPSRKHIATASADNTIKFWDIFECAKDLLLDETLTPEMILKKEIEENSEVVR